MSRSSSQPRSFRPSVEGLEQRSLMACNVFTAGSVLNIVGDGGNDHIVVRDGGDGTVEGAATGYGAFSAQGITDIVIDAGNGNDHVDYNLIHDLQAGPARIVAVALRDGNDQFAASLHGPGGVS